MFYSPENQKTLWLSATQAEQRVFKTLTSLVLYFNLRLPAYMWQNSFRRILIFSLELLHVFLISFSLSTSFHFKLAEHGYIPVHPRHKYLSSRAVFIWVRFLRHTSGFFIQSEVQPKPIVTRSQQQQQQQQHLYLYPR